MSKTRKEKLGFAENFFLSGKSFYLPPFFSYPLLRNRRMLLYFFFTGYNIFTIVIDTSVCIFDIIWGFIIKLYAFCVIYL